MLPFSEAQELLDFVPPHSQQSVILLLDATFALTPEGAALIQSLKQNRSGWKFLLLSSPSEAQNLSALLRRGLVDDFLWRGSFDALRLELILRHLQAEQRLELESQEQQSRMDLQYALLGRIAHDIQSPMVPLEGYLEWLQQEASEQTPEQQHRIFTNMAYGMQRLRQEIHELVFLEAFAFNGIQSKFKEIVFHDFFLNIHHLIQGPLNGSEVSWELTYSARDDLLWADEEQLARALSYFFEQVIALAMPHVPLRVTVSTISAKRLQQRLSEPLKKQQYLCAYLQEATQHDYLELAVHVRSNDLSMTVLEKATSSLDALKYIVQHAHASRLERSIAVLLKMLERHCGCFYFENQAPLGGYMSLYLPLLGTTAGRM